MSKVGVHPRVTERHPEIEDSDVISSMKAMIRYRQREKENWVAIGVDKKGRLLELVYQYDDESDFFFVYHCMTPPSRKTFQELNLER